MVPCFAFVGACQAPTAVPVRNASNPDAPRTDEPSRLVTERTEQLTLPPEAQWSADPGAEAALRRHIESVLRGAPNYDDLVPELAAGIRGQPGALKSIVDLGEIRSIAFKGKGPRGLNLFDVTTPSSVTHWRIGLNPEGDRKSVV